MLRNIIDLLQSADWLVKCEIIEIAKGKNELPKTIKGATKKIKRQWLKR